MRWRYGDATAAAALLTLGDGSEVIVKGSAAACNNCQRRWREEFPDTPQGCLQAGLGLNPPTYFDFKTGATARCANPSPDVLNVSALHVLDVLSDVADQITGEGGGVSVLAALKVAEVRGYPVDGLFIDLWRAASTELSVMRGEAIKRRMAERR